MKRGLIVIFVLCCCVVAAAQAQPSTAPRVDLRGSVADPDGAVVPDAYVVIGLPGQKNLRVRTGKNGQFHFRASEGTYYVEIGFAPFSRIIANQAFTAASVTEFRFSSIIAGGGPSSIQVQPQVQPGMTNNWEYGAFVQGGVGLQDRTNFSFFMLGLHAGRILTSDFFTGALKGNFEYAVEVMPFWQSYTPKFQHLVCPLGATVASLCGGPYTTGGTYTGFSITPIILRYNLTHGKRIMPWVQGAGGVLYTTRKYPAVGNLNVTDPTQTGPAADTSVWNFTPQGGIGAHYFVRDRRSVDMSLNAVHISSASLGDKNPGVNVALQFGVGYTWWK